MKPDSVIATLSIDTPAARARDGHQNLWKFEWVTVGLEEG
jgi:hypothetical protein